MSNVVLRFIYVVIKISFFFMFIVADDYGGERQYVSTHELSMNIIL